MRKFTLSAAAALTSMLTILTCPAYTYASSDHDFEDKNTDTGYQLIIDDEADFLTSDEEESLSEVMYETAGYSRKSSLQGAGRRAIRKKES